MNSPQIPSAAQPTSDVPLRSCTLLAPEIRFLAHDLQCCGKCQRPDTPARERPHRRLAPGGDACTHAALTEGAAKLAAGESGLLALDWHNGNRTVLVDQRLTGVEASKVIKALLA